MYQVSVVIPVYNSAECLKELHGQLRKFQVDAQIVMVDDRSRDDSFRVMCELAAIDRDFIAIQLRKNSGQDNAILAGLRHAKGLNVVIMDDDLQHSPSDIQDLKLKLEMDDADVVFANFHRKKQNLWKNIGSWFNSKMSEVIVGKPKGIYLSPFKIMRGDLAQEICKYPGPYPYIDGLILNYTHNLSELAVDHHGRYRGKSNYSFKKSVQVWAKHATGFSVYPLRVASVLGLSTALVGFLLAIGYLIIHFFSNIYVPGWTTLVCLQLIFGGLILCCMGVVGEYLGRTYMSIGQKPQYSIREIKSQKS